MKWLSRDWWAYLLEKPERNRDGAIGRLRDWWTSILCRLKGHPYGVVWFNVGGYEPDMHCKNCGDDLS